MIKTRLKYCIYDPDPNGNPRYYVRKPGHKKIRIKEAFQDATGQITPAFMKAYFAALEGLVCKHMPPKTPREKTFYWLVDQYYRSTLFQGFDKLTQADKRSVLNRYCETAGNLPFDACRKEDVEASRDKRRTTPGAADKLVKYLRDCSNGLSVRSSRHSIPPWVLRRSMKRLAGIRGHPKRSTSTGIIMRSARRRVLLSN
jgi:hypothetical protein